MLGASDVEIDHACQQGLICLLQGQQQTKGYLEDEQHQHQAEEAQTQALGFVTNLDHAPLLLPLLRCAWTVLKVSILQCLSDSPGKMCGFR